jgi:parvulin-like peptidyl-prolyl isomerase
VPNVTLRNLQIGVLAACAGVGLSLFAVSLRAQDTKSAPTEPALATYQGGVITRADFEKVAAIKVPELRIALAKSDEKKRELLDAMIDFELLLQEAQRRGYDDHPIVKLSTREESVRRLIEGPLVVAPESLSDAEIDAEYEKHKAEFEQPARRRARHVVLATEEEAKALIAEAQKPGVRAPDLIARAAREKSLDTETKRQSGELGYFFESGQRPSLGTTVDPALASAAFALKKKDDVVAKPIAVPGGFSVLVLLEKVELLKLPPAEAKQAVREKLAGQRSEAAVDAVAAEIEKTHPTQTFPDRNSWITLDRAATADMPQGFRAAPLDPTAPPVITEPDGI